MSHPTEAAGYYRRSYRIVATGVLCFLAAGISVAGAVATLNGRLSAGLPTPRAALPPQEGPPPDTGRYVQSNNHFGEITVAQPKIWQYERVNSMLDGLLRDVQGVSMADLTALDPNATNGAAVRFVQSMLEIGAQYNQGQAAANQLALQSYQANLALSNAQTAANQAYLQQLYQERAQANAELLSAMQLNSGLMTQLATAPAGSDTTTLQAQQNAASSEVAALQQELSSINSQITAASTTTQPALPNLTPTAAGAPPETANTFSSFLGNLPSGLTSNIVNQLQTPTLPATKRLDNFVTLLYERLAREISALQDDLLRDPENLAFLVQFDVSLYPSKHSEDRVGVVDFGLECLGCEVYTIYPGQSSYNLANYEGASKRNQFWGNLLTLFGLGISADYRRQEDTLHGDLTQSVYISGFQEGAESYDRALDAGKKTAVQQRFGWYYGASPFEKLVSPGIRSTFAVLTVPRQYVVECRQGPAKGKCAPGLRLNEENDDVELKIDVHAGWTPRDNPRGYYSRYLPSPGLNAIEVALPGAEGASLPRVVTTERDRLHVLGIEYNPVYFSDAPANSSTPSTASPGTAQATATGSGAGASTVSVSGAGTATASSTGTANSTATATATNPTPSATNNSASSSSTTGSFAGCLKTNACAGVLLKLAEPIDPNMVVTVRGQPLLRVHDWRGRATSIYPPAQSASDRLGGANATPGTAASTTSGATTSAGATQPPGSENSASNSLLESDQLGPNTWMEVDSHRLLLNITHDVAGEEDFPSIQIVAPAKHGLFVPVDLDTNFTEIVTNGFHMLGRDTTQLEDYVCNHLTKKPCDSFGPDLGETAVHPTGPYAAETFLPLFLPEPDDQPIYAYMGETGVQILISFDQDSTGARTGTQAKVHRWLASRTQAILEDRELDLAWSLGCYPQGDQLVCDFPRQEIRDAYDIVKKICSVTRFGGCPSIPDTNYPSISTLQLWVEQSDPDDKHPNAFRSAAPARLARFPVTTAGGSEPDANFSPWHFESATSETVKLVGCNYPDWSFQAGYDVNLLGQHIPGQDRTEILKPGPGNGCLHFEAPTIVFSRPEFVITYPSNLDQPESLSTSTFRPSFGRPVVLERNSDGGFSVSSWTVDIPVGKVECNDSIDVPGAFGQSNENDPSWLIGGIPSGNLRRPDALIFGGCESYPNWEQVSKGGQVHLTMTITKANLNSYLAHRDIHLVRGPDRVEVATLPDLQSLLLPTQLTVVPISETQFALQGVNAEAIDKVSLQGPGAPTEPLTAATSPGIAVITLPGLKSASSPQSGGMSGTPDVKKVSQSDSTLTITGENFGSAAGSVVLLPINATATGGRPATVAPPKPNPVQKGSKGSVAGTQDAGAAKSAAQKPSAPAAPIISAPMTTVVCWSDTSIQVKLSTVDGQAYTVKVNRSTATSSDPAQVTLAKTDVDAAKSNCPAPANASNGNSGTYTILPLIVTTKDAKGVPTGYYPINNTDANGKPAPLTWVVPAPQKTDTSTPKTPGDTTTITINKQTSGATPVTPAPAATPPKKQ